MPRKTDAGPPQTAPEEGATLLGFLDYPRGAITAKAEGAPEPQVRSAGVPPGTSLLGLIKHLACVERFYFLGEDVDDWAATMRPAPEETADGVLADYREAVRRSNEVIKACTDLTNSAPRAGKRRSAPSMRWVLAHMIKETGGTRVTPTSSASRSTVPSAAERQATASPSALQAPDAVRCVGLAPRHSAQGIPSPAVRGRGRRGESGRHDWRAATTNSYWPIASCWWS